MNANMIENRVPNVVLVGEAASREAVDTAQGTCPGDARRVGRSGVGTRYEVYGAQVVVEEVSDGDSDAVVRIRVTPPEYVDRIQSSVFFDEVSVEDAWCGGIVLGAAIYSLDRK